MHLILDAVNMVKTEIWPLIHQQLPGKEIVIYGALFICNKLKKWPTKPKEGFYIAGFFATDLEMRFTKARINFLRLYPLWSRQKAKKLLDAMWLLVLLVLPRSLAVEGDDQWLSVLMENRLMRQRHLQSSDSPLYLDKGTNSLKGTTKTATK